MTRNEFMAAISRLTVQPGSDGGVTGRQTYLLAAGAFNRTGAAGWLWFRKRAGETLDAGDSRAEIVEWLQGATEMDIGRLIEAMASYRSAIKAAAHANGPPPLVIPSSERIDHLMTGESKRKAEAKKAGHMKRGSGMSKEVLKIAGEIALEMEANGEKPLDPWNLSLDIASRMRKKSNRQIYRILAPLGTDASEA
jgi:hypothetical protein